MMKVDTKKIIIIVLAVLLVVAVGYIVGLKYSQYMERKNNEIMSFGINKGYELAIRQLIQESSNCNPVSVHINNVSVSFIAVECLRMPPNSSSENAGALLGGLFSGSV